ncbi:TetR/AcrR family transcriptional regulator [Candidatus Puniceispirillum sp.]|uniref:TetR/AcrR family transcriptional regulator n=1 Tax=Candidatus Puniceispirillum sp. TaxID=2026719 RepID=UPI001ED2E491|nr:TetR/AcrR family transcriptional regulator [Candidatus Puniceispirillum sp.]MBT6567110.1 TetR/AcrR family transcriptional regulator [Candidatus Puniceispirillum sp.]
MISAQKKHGRPVSFDRNKTIQTALDLYWRQGVLATSLNQVARMTGVSKPTLYRYFENEDGLLYDVLECYLSGNVDKFECLEAHENIRHGLTEWFEQIITAWTATDASPHGCLFCDCLHEIDRLGVKSQSLIKTYLSQQPEKLASILSIARDKGQLKDGVDVHQAALYLSSHVIAMNSMVKMGISTEQLLSISDLVIGSIVR